MHHDVTPLQGEGGADTGMHLWTDNYSEVPYIAPGLVKGKELVVDEWEVCSVHVV